MNSEIVYWLDALNGIGKSPDLHFGVLVKNTLVEVTRVTLARNPGNGEHALAAAGSIENEVIANVDLVGRT